MEHAYTNELIHESSPYLLQHAHNPVNWMPWNEKTLAKAKEENKPLLISIGYSACHWCHVMEHESFEDTAIAELMNENFICIKIDREERPDIDQVYMNAVQLMTGRGGWPLNCFATPDGRPFYGGTYFPKEGWVDVLNQISGLYKNDPQKVEEYANKLTSGVQSSELIERNNNKVAFSKAALSEGLKKWQSTFDPKFGGNNQAPKFPIPSNYDFLLRYYYHTKDQSIKKHLLVSLEKMAYGGIYDQIGGGFARYSTDMKWKVPHFEKMLYDNAQLISLYSKAFQLEKNPIYKSVVQESIQFVKE
ncbi:MAG: thioredoxin domain-containing protein, partial [Flavobacteriales bacterium]|nr:thioredoxin domain-containing protein [Flavobacteriales bacterium]